MRISSMDEYRGALERISRLRTSGQSVDSNTEMADLQAAVEAYETRLDEPGLSKGKPQSEVQPKFDTKKT